MVPICVHNHSKRKGHADGKNEIGAGWDEGEIDPKEWGNE